jgi:Uri superfamily endonuclease
VGRNLPIRMRRRARKYSFTLCLIDSRLSSDNRFFYLVGLILLKIQPSIVIPASRFSQDRIDSIQWSGACYSLILHIKRKLDVQVGALGAFHLAPGEYIYTGRAKRNGIQRIRRHLSKSKKLRWHSDYLTVHPDVEIHEVLLYDLNAEHECRINQHIRKLKGASLPIPGFGASDCRSGCGSHLVKISLKTH